MQRRESLVSSSLPVARESGVAPYLARRGWAGGLGMCNMTTEERFWKKVDRSGGPDACWTWTAYRDCRGYGQVGYAGRVSGAHRVAWAMTHGDMPVGLCVCHRCDNPPCCNPAHLFVGTHADNNADMISKGRHVAPRGDDNGSRLHPERLRRGDNHPARVRPECLARGEASGTAKLREPLVLEIRERAENGESHRAIARSMDISRCTVRQIVRRQTWAHL